MSDRCIIVGGGHAGAQAAVSLRQLNFPGEVAIVTEEHELPYQRPPLSKKYLTGALDDEQILLRQRTWYRDHDVVLHSGKRVEDLDLDARVMRLANGDALTFDQAVLATGSRLRRLDVAGGTLPGIHYLRSVEDSRRLRDALAGARRVGIVGGGYIGLEVAASAREIGVDVCVIEKQENVLPRVASPLVADAVARMHRAAGVELRCAAGVVAFEGDASGVKRILLDDGDAVAVDAVVVGIGVEPETALAEAAGLRVDDGVVVDEFCRTSHPRVYAAGDCTSHPNRFLRRRVRLESVPNATGQGRTAAAAIAGQPTPNADAPWFWSEQYGVRLQTAGLLDPAYATIVRGDPGGASFALYHVADGRLMAMEAMGRVQEFMLGRKLIEAEAVVDDLLADDSQPIKLIAEKLLGGSA